MVKTTLPSRIIVTFSFYKKHIHNNFGLLINLMRININSKQHSRKHIVICKKDFKKITEEDPKYEENEDIIMAAVKRVDSLDEYDEIESDAERVIKCAIDLSSDKPYDCLIFCNEEEKKDFEDNKHFKGMKKIRVVTDEDALLIFNDFYEICMDKDYYG